MRSCPFVVLVAVLMRILPCLCPAEVPSKAQPPSAVIAPEKAGNRTLERILQPRAPVAGQPFDDREIELYVEAEARKLLAGDRIHPLQFERRSSGLQLPAPGAEKIAASAIAARAEAATLVLGEFSRDGKKRELAFAVAGGAFVVHPSGICLTSLHVAKEKNSRGLCAMTRDGRVFAVREVLAFEPVNDLVLLQLELPAEVTLPALPLAREAAPVGAPVFVMSHPDNRFYLLSAGFVARHVLWRTEAGDEAFMTITADFAKGSSGCPVLDERGAVVGIVNNTESIYYDDDGRKKQTDLQMVVKNATPSWAVQPMIESTPPPSGR